jgi:hypothetical protein
MSRLDEMTKKMADTLDAEQVLFLVDLIAPMASAVIALDEMDEVERMVTLAVDKDARDMYDEKDVIDNNVKLLKERYFTINFGKIYLN